MGAFFFKEGHEPVWRHGLSLGFTNPRIRRAAQSGLVRKITCNFNTLYGVCVKSRNAWPERSVCLA